jgi:UDP-N-acetylmuramoyl-L-alanyl-D-glutamate--2,6-diaminopimelate ligase
MLAPIYHGTLAYLGAIIYGFPSRQMRVIGITGTKGKSSVVYLTGKILEKAGNKKVATLGSMGFRIGEREWPNVMKMTMPGRFEVHNYMAQARKAGCEYFIMEVTSEGIKQNRHLGINFDCAVFTGLHKEHIESHGSFENYYRAKQELFKITKNVHIFNADDPHVGLFGDFIAKKKITYGVERGDIRAENLALRLDGASFECYGTKFNIHLAGKFNVSNCLGALAIAAMYDVDLPSASPVIEEIKSIPGRMQFIQCEPFKVVVDYAHTPDSLREVYKTLKPVGHRLICVLGSCGGGRDRWKRPEFGKIAEEFCDRIILTNEDPYDEDPEKIIAEIKSGISEDGIIKTEIILDRKEAIRSAIESADIGDVVIITGKGSETTMALKHGKIIKWSDAGTVTSLL